MKKRRMRNLFILNMVCFIFLTAVCAAQQKEYKEIEIVADYICTDHLGYLYIVDGNTLLKCDSLGNELFSYSNLQYGNISSIDVSNPLKILLFFRDFSSVIYLDNSLAPQSDMIHLQEISNNLKDVCTSYDNALWIYDAMDSQLIRYDKKLRKTASSGNLALLLNKEITVFALQEVANKVYISAADGIYVFDRYAAFLRYYPFENPSCLAVMNNSLFFLQNQNYIRYNMLSLEKEILDFSNFNPKCISFGTSFIYLYGQKKLKIIKQ
jgi:hypothetical protein